MWFKERSTRTIRSWFTNNSNFWSSQSETNFCSKTLAHRYWLSVSWLWDKWSRKRSTQSDLRFCKIALAGSRCKTASNIKELRLDSTHSLSVKILNQSTRVFALSTSVWSILSCRKLRIQPQMLTANSTSQERLVCPPGSCQLLTPPLSKNHRGTSAWNNSRTPSSSNLTRAATTSSLPFLSSNLREPKHRICLLSRNRRHPKNWKFSGTHLMTKYKC